MTTSLPPSESHLPSPSIPPPPQGASAGRPGPGTMPKPRRRRWWIIAGVVIAGVLGVGIAGVVLNGAMHTIDTYTADLTKGSGDFRAIANASSATFYRADGYHMVAKTPGFVFAGATTDFSHTAIAAKVIVRAVTAPPGAAFGPFVLASQTGGGYWLSVDSTGTARLNEIDAKGNVWTVTSAKAPPLSTGTTHTLMLTCVINGTVHLAGYVDGRPVISGVPAIKISSSTAAGMMGQAKTSAPAQWVATRFARLGPDDMPANTPSQPLSPDRASGPQTPVAPWIASDLTDFRLAHGSQPSDDCMVLRGLAEPLGAPQAG